MQGGFSLIEVLVALIVISIGLLGNAGMQALSINNTAIARNRSLGAIEADALASMMHANVGYWQSPLVPAIGFTITGSQGGLYTATVLGNTTLNSQTTDCVANPCTTGLQMAGYDLKQWGLAVANLLPAGIGNVTCSAASATAPVSCVIRISWTENNLALNQSTGTETGNLASGTSVTQNYTLAVQP